MDACARYRRWEASPNKPEFCRATPANARALRGMEEAADKLRREFQQLGSAAT